MQLIETFERGVELNPRGTCFVTADGSRAWSYAETSAITHRIAHRLAEGGAGEGTKVGVLSPNDPLAFMCILAALRLNAIWVGLNARSSTDDLGDLLELTGCEVLFYAGAMAGTADELVRRVPSLRELVSIGAGGRPGDPVLEQWMSPEGAAVGLPAHQPEAVAMLVGTGGTTGRPKAVQVPHRAFTTMTFGFVAHMPEERPVQLLAAPMTHAAGALTFPVLAMGGTTVVSAAIVPDEIFTAIERHRVTRLFLPPTAIYALLARADVRDRDFSSLRYFLYGAAPMSVEKLKDAIDVFGPVMTQVFGQAEVPMIVAFLGPHEHAAAVADPALEGRLASCGRPSVVAHVGIMSDDGALVGPGEKGEIVVRSDLRMLGYYEDPEQTASVDMGGGWHGTSDIGYRDEDGYVYIVDRKRDMIITGGFNVFPSEVEQVIWSHPAVNDCAVVGVPDEKWGEAVTAVVEVKDGEKVEPQEIVALCRERLGGVKTPKSVMFRTLPRSAVGKVLKRELRDEFWADRTRAV